MLSLPGITRGRGLTRVWSPVHRSEQVTCILAPAPDGLIYSAGRDGCIVTYTVEEPHEGEQLLRASGVQSVGHEVSIIRGLHFVASETGACLRPQCSIRCCMLMWWSDVQRLRPIGSALSRLCYDVSQG